ncbi:hypothetical protein V6N11_079680 [Hibiscus sabdariffa]|uniref:Uncharacterized protein n=1 Tax=Hibiscus sabdariffa TaxID=183260 RepID=A0ABR2RWM0_9ROSI
MEKNSIAKDATETVMVKPKSGNNGSRLAVIAVANGYRLMITMPFSMAFGARVVLSIRLNGRKLQLRRSGMYLREQKPDDKGRLSDAA